MTAVPNLLLIAVKAAMEYRQSLGGGPDWESLHNWNKLCKALDAITESGAILAMEQLERREDNAPG